MALDLAIVGLGGRRRSAILRCSTTWRVAPAVIPPEVGAFLGRLDRIAELVEGNAGPELALDVLVLAWPGTARGLAA